MRANTERFKSLSVQYWMVFVTTFFGTALILAVLFGLKMSPPRTLLGLFAVIGFLALMVEKAVVHYAIQGLRKRGYNASPCPRAVVSIPYCTECFRL